ncbi:MAG TPA: hypothetical protein VMU13_03110 [Candidatus Paceibacterota bacterium]|nr:hypothetical protein [Candidatus Paceibacterota bacterium]
MSYISHKQKESQGATLKQVAVAAYAFLPLSMGLVVTEKDFGVFPLQESLRDITTTAILLSSWYVQGGSLSIRNSKDSPWNCFTISISLISWYCLH